MTSTKPVDWGDNLLTDILGSWAEVTEWAHGLIILTQWKSW